jgi:hypothetical protein
MATTVVQYLTYQIYDPRRGRFHPLDLSLHPWADQALPHRNPSAMTIVQQGSQLRGVFCRSEFELSQQGSQWKGERGEFGVQESDGRSFGDGIL